MSDDMKKSLRTQGRFSDKGPRNRDKRHKESPVEKEPPGKKSFSQKRNSTGRQNKERSFNNESENDSPVKYEENSSYSFSELDTRKPTEIRAAGLHKLSETAHGISTILYEPSFIEEFEGYELFNILKDITNWNTKNIIIRGQEYPQPRLVAWYGPFPYAYSGVTLEPAEMPDCVLAVKERIEDFLKKQEITVTLNSVLLNYYRDGHDSVAWHSDDELTMGICPTIASVSVGAFRRFEMKRKVQSYEEEIFDDDVDQYFINLTHGSLLIMNGSMQVDWLHRIPKDYHDKPPRINLTFRTVYSLDKIPSGISAKDFKIFSKKDVSNKSPGSQIVLLNDNDFPPLVAGVNAFISNDENSHEISQDSNLSVDSEKSMELFDNSNLNPPFSSSVNNFDCSYLSKHDLQNKNIHSDNSFASENDVINADDSTDRNENFECNTFEQDEPMSVESFPDGMPKIKHVHEVPLFNSNLNANAVEFVPTYSPVPAQIKDFSGLDLEDLLCYYPKLEDYLNEFAYALKDKVMVHLQEFRIFEKNEFKFLFSLMEEKLPDITLKKITERICFILQKGSKFNYSGPPRQEYRESQRDTGHSSGGKRYSNRGERYSNQESTNHEDTYFNRGGRHNRFYQGERLSNRVERRQIREDGSSQAVRSIRQ